MFCDKTDLPRIRMREQAYAIGGQPWALRSTAAIKVPLHGGFSISNHALGRSIERGVSKTNIQDAIDHPLHKTGVTLDSKGRPSYQLIGERATIAVNPDTGMIASTWKTKAGLRRKY
ncbi:MAG: hypothetical protein RBS78_05455 [Coriobacteriia bacterium]|jgi:hypothetical protein|nr:hypothetical protein [Coriobacteriia bacterium]